MSGRTSGRTKSRRSSLTAAVPRTASHPRSDGTYRGSFPGQLTLAIDVPAPGPQLVVTVHHADSGTTTSQPSTPDPQFALLGDVLARVLDFHEAFDLPREPLPTTYVGDSLAQLRVRLLREEVEEFADATENRDLVAIADALADVVYVAYGSAVTYGIDLDAVVREVHRSNMSKVDANGRPVLREDGKVLKSPRYHPPNVRRVLDEQLPLFDPGGRCRVTPRPAPPSPPSDASPNLIARVL
jgi:predicted HAD superfamily Cof-like phosphohydrolase